MLAETVFEVGCDAGVIPVVLFDYIEVPHILNRTSLVVSLLGTSSHRSEPIEGLFRAFRPKIC